MNNTVIPDGFERHFRQSPLTDPWEPLYSKRTDKAVIVGLRLAKPHTNAHGLIHGGLIATLADNAMGYSTTLADLFTPLPFGDLSSAVLASLRSWSNDEFDDGVAYGRQARLRWRPVDSFFSAPLVRVGDAGGTRRRSLS